MKSTFYFLVRVVEDYTNHIKLSNDTLLAVNNSIESVSHINRVGEIVSAPKGSNALSGDIVMFHHNICRRSWGQQGKKRQSPFYVKDNIYYIPVTEIFMIKRGDSQIWEALDPYVFVKPLLAEKRNLKNGLEVLEEDYKDRKNLIGTVSFPNKTLKNAGVKQGDTVAFKEDAEYEFKIGGEIYYRMKTTHILAVYEGTKSRHTISS